MIPEREREALMRLTMCAREECIMCEYHKECDFDFQYELATESMNILAEALRKTEPTCSKMEQVEDEPQTNADQHVQRVEYVENDERSRCWKCKHFERMHETPISSDGKYYTYVVCTAKECDYELKDEPQTCSVNGRPYDCGNCEYFRCTADEPQTNKEIVLDPSFAELSDEQFVEAMKLIEPQTDCPWK